MTGLYEYDSEQEVTDDGDLKVLSGEAVAVVGASNASPIVIDTTPNAHGLVSGDLAEVVGATGNTGANGTFPVMKLTDYTLSLNDSAGNGDYTGGATIQKVGLLARPKSLSLGEVQIEEDAQPWNPCTNTTGPGEFVTARHRVRAF